MTRPVTIYRVRIMAPAHGMGDVAALLDMLRYEGARVSAWTTDRDSRDREILVVTIASEQYVPDRWASFGITPEVAS
jgi:hypothetical protein